MTIAGEMLIGWQSIGGVDATLHALNPTTGVTLDPASGGGSAREMPVACQLAQSVFHSFRELPLEKRPASLGAIAEGLISLRDEPVEKDWYFSWPCVQARRVRLSRLQRHRRLIVRSIVTLKNTPRLML